MQTIFPILRYNDARRAMRSLCATFGFVELFSVPESGPPVRHAQLRLGTNVTMLGSARQHRELYHEISHLWNVPDTDRPSPRWNEGLATFLESLVTQEATGEPALDSRANSLLAWLRGALPTHETWRQVALVDYGRAGLTDLSYSVGAVYFDLLYRLVGRETFNRIIGGYVADFRTRGGSARELMDVVRRNATVDLSHLNDDWILSAARADRVEHSAGIQDLETHYRRGAPPP